MQINDKSPQELYKAEIEARDKRIAELEACVLDFDDAAKTATHHFDYDYSRHKLHGVLNNHQGLIKSIQQRGEK